MGELGLPFPENDSPPHSPNRRMKKIGLLILGKQSDFWVM